MAEKIELTGHDVIELAEKEAMNIAPIEKGIIKYFSPINRMRKLERLCYESGFLAGYLAAQEHFTEK